MNVYMNKRLAYHNIYLAKHRSIHCDDTIDLSPYPLSLCHGDICRRNIILREDGSPCLLNWGLAGFYPRFFELVALKCTMPYADEFGGALERQFEAAMGLADEERRDMQLVTFNQYANYICDEPSQAKHDALIESLERHAGVGKGNTADQAGYSASEGQYAGNQPDGKTTSDDGPEDPVPTDDSEK
ncbi:hypothetical protein BJY01DRAFT_245088 [Aspergillus pseudoustus]|uniref:Aminoglycoside phosphotransferase domain-containing protein n=1 Tax=Aspergillus pseudoustus TaxID=1810923 RepID=A0ABR4KFU5_9EURO